MVSFLRLFFWSLNSKSFSCFNKFLFFCVSPVLILNKFCSFIVKVFFNIFETWSKISFNTTFTTRYLKLSYTDYLRKALFLNENLLRSRRFLNKKTRCIKLVFSYVIVHLTVWGTYFDWFIERFKSEFTERTKEEWTPEVQGDDGYEFGTIFSLHW